MYTASHSSIRSTNCCFPMDNMTDVSDALLIGGPLLFNVFINDIFYFLEHGTLFSYADDYTESFAHLIWTN